MDMQPQVYAFVRDIALRSYDQKFAQNSAIMGPAIRNSVKRRKYVGNCMVATFIYYIIATWVET